MSELQDHPRWGKVYAATVDEWPEGEPLTSEEVSALQDGDEIIVRWSGGNGPHKYIVCEIGGWLYPRSEHEDEDWFRQHIYKYTDPLSPTFYLTSYGVERWHTKVWKVEERLNQEIDWKQVQAACDCFRVYMDAVVVGFQKMWEAIKPAINKIMDIYSFLPENLKWWLEFQVDLDSLGPEEKYIVDSRTLKKPEWKWLMDFAHENGCWGIHCVEFQKYFVTVLHCGIKENTWKTQVNKIGGKSPYLWQWMTTTFAMTDYIWDYDDASIDS
jgi:hypothetical protein